MPFGTALFFEPLQRFGQDIARRVFIPIHHQTTVDTAMGTFTQAFLDPGSTATTILTGEMGSNDHNGDRVDQAIVPDPL